MAIIYSYSDVKSFIEENSNCKLLTSESDYKNTHQKLELICSCGRNFKTSFGEFKGDKYGNNTRQCHYCINKQRRLSHLLPYGKLVNTIESKHCILLTSEEEWIEFGKSNYHLSIQCSCGNSFTTTYSMFTREKNPKICCDDCTKQKLILEKRKKDFPKIKAFIEENGEELLSDENEYYNSQSKLKIRCPNKHIREQTWNKYFYRGHRCPICNKYPTYSYKEVKNYINDIGMELLTNEDNYENCKTRLSIKCSKGHIFNQTFDAINNANCTCPHCSMSFGEQKLLNILTQKDIEFETQYTFDDCKSDKSVSLRFDFAILSNGTVDSLIEVNGQQHYNPIDIWGGEKKLQIQKRNDEIKIKYCQDNNIPLLIIPYWEIDKMEEIIDSWIS